MQHFSQLAITAPDYSARAFSVVCMNISSAGLRIHRRTSQKKRRQLRRRRNTYTHRPTLFSKNTLPRLTMSSFAAKMKKIDMTWYCPLNFGTTFLLFAFQLLQTTFVFYTLLYKIFVRPAIASHPIYSQLSAPPV
jgi:hypothetical protein